MKCNYCSTKFIKKIICLFYRLKKCQEQPSSRYFSELPREDDRKSKHKIISSNLIDFLCISLLMYFNVMFLGFFSTFSVAQQNVGAAAFERCVSKGASENLNYKNENLGLMKSMDITTEDMNTISSANDEPSNDNNVGVDYGQISKRQLKDICFTNAGREGGLSKNYE